jgi:bifunctional N-acetylglucosamine-1-phosphate-uridyltransferase/glucosamine-1-phosphate-acetyltransferase GlmU-like protein
MLKFLTTQHLKKLIISHEQKLNVKVIFTQSLKNPKLFNRIIRTFKKKN